VIAGEVIPAWLTFAADAVLAFIVGWFLGSRFGRH
jgi:hypothetical protein